MRIAMPWGRRIDQHRSINYAETQERLDVPFDVQRQPDGKRVKYVVTGNCPACGGLMTKEFSYGISGNGSKGMFADRREPAIPSQVTLYCECGYFHAEKPAGAIDDGCGRYWKIDLTTP
jgi:hypothetical protein